MSRIRDLAKILTASTAIASHAAAADPHTVYLKESEYWAAGKNVLLNGDFRINQRSFTSLTSNGSYGFDRWLMQKGGTDGTCTYTPQTFTPGTAPVVGYEAINFARLVTAGGTATNVFAFLAQRIEDVRTFAAQTITVSFWAKAASGTPKIALDIEQFFGTGGSAQLNTPGGSVTISTSWARYSITVTVPSVSTKTIASTDHFIGILLWVSSGSTYNTRASSIGIQNGTFDIWGVQAEIGSTATPFQTTTGNIQGELAACQRYYYRVNSSTSPWTFFGNGLGYTTGELGIVLAHPVTMRSEAISIETSAMNTFLMEQHATSSTNTPSSIIIDTGASSVNNTVLAVTKSASFTLGAIYRLLSNNSTSAYIGVNAEL
jgi:hypothetical protein